jgi:hypothetical protein
MRSRSSSLCRLAAGAALTACLAPSLPAQQHAAAARGTAAPAPNSLDAFMSRVLERRDEAWRKLHDYVLSETESFGIDDPANIPLNGFRREFTWYVRDGILVRSPLRFDGVAIPEADRRKYEENWFKQEKAREARARSRAGRSTAQQAGAATGADKPATADKADAADRTDAAGKPDKGDTPSLDQFVDQRGEPRFISEAYFMRFKFEPGNYYLVGRERLEGREVVRVEYYPTRLFTESKPRDDGRSASPPSSGPGPKPAQKPQKKPDGIDEQELDRKLNKVSLVTLWIDPAEYQIVKYTFDNMGFDFLPGRWFVRVNDVSASMVMARVLDGVWLPGRITVRAGLSFASGTYGFKYDRAFYDYKKAEVGARIRGVVPKRP